MHIAMLHLPPAQPGVPLGTAAHAVPQVPQLPTSVATLISQPSARFLLQSANPNLHDAPHVELAQMALAFIGVGHTLPQPPQLFAFVAVVVSQPFVATPSQSEKPPKHMEMPHWPLRHAGVALGVWQTLLHAPQLL